MRGCPSLTMIAGVLTRKWGWKEHTGGHGNRYFTLPDGVQGPSLTVNLLFRDASNQAWKRDSRCTLSDRVIRILSGALAAVD